MWGQRLEGKEEFEFEPRGKGPKIVWFGYRRMFEFSIEQIIGKDDAV